MEKISKVVSIFVQVVKDMDWFSRFLLTFNICVSLYGLVTLHPFYFFLNGALACFIVWARYESIKMSKRTDELLEKIKDM